MSVLSLKILFWFGAAIIFYAYIGYGLVLWLAVRLKRRPKTAVPASANDLPEVSFIVCAYNEADFIGHKIHNSLALDYPRNRVVFLSPMDRTMLPLK